MGIHYNDVKRLEGKPALFHCRGGKICCGMVRKVTPTMVYYSPLPYGAGPVSNQSEDMEVINANNGDEAMIELVQFFGNYQGGFNPGYNSGRNAILALALFDILAISLFFW